jgi:pimeloyl-ACP methyl ester carboxylesterase
LGEAGVRPIASGRVRSAGGSCGTSGHLSEGLANVSGVNSGSEFNFQRPTVADGQIARWTRRTDVATGLSVEEAGDPHAPTMLLLHGLTDSADTWAPIASAGVNRYRLVAVDLRWHGRSPRFTNAELAGDAAQVMAQDVVQLMQGLAMEHGPVDVLGQSLGAVLALAAATRTPSSVRALVLEDPAPAEGDWSPGVKQPFLDEQIKMLDAFGSADPALRPTLSPRWSQAEIQRCLQARLLVDRRLITSGHITPPGRLADLIDALEVPTLILVADPSHLDDMLPPPSNPVVTVKRVSGAGHCMHRDEPDQFHHLLDVWLSGPSLSNEQQAVRGAVKASLALAASR